MSEQEEFDPKEFSRDISLSHKTLDEAFRDQAGLFAYYSSILRNYTVSYEKSKMVVEVTESQVANRIRAEMAKEGIKVTEKIITDATNVDKNLVQKKLDSIEKRGKMELVKNALTALAQHKDMLIQLGAKERKEREGEMRMNRRASQDD